MSSRRSNIVEFSPAVYEFARFMAPGQEDRYLKHYLDSKDLREFPPGTFTDWSPYTSRPEQVTLPPVSNLLSPAGLPPSSPHVDPQLYLDHEVSDLAHAGYKPGGRHSSSNFAGNRAPDVHTSSSSSFGAYKNEPMEQAPAAESFAGSSLYATREVDTQPEEVDPQLGEADPHSGGAYPQSLAQSPSSGSSSPTKSPYASVPESRRPSKSRASRAHFLELVTRGKLRVADELVVQLRRQIQTHGQTVSVDDVGVFTFLGRTKGHHRSRFSDWMFRLASSTNGESTDVQVKGGPTGFRDALAAMGLEGPKLNQFGSIVRVRRGGQDMGTLTEFKESVLFD